MTIILAVTLLPLGSTAESQEKWTAMDRNQLKKAVKNLAKVSKEMTKVKAGVDLAYQNAKELRGEIKENRKELKALLKAFKAQIKNYDAGEYDKLLTRAARVNNWISTNGGDDDVKDITDAMKEVEGGMKKAGSLFPQKWP